MKGAREYAEVLGTGQYQHDKLFILCGKHARGYTLHVFVTDEARKIENIHTYPGKVEVYGVTGGQPGWTETYGWLHKGKWQDDFELFIASKKLAQEEALRINTATTLEREQRERERITALLEKY